MAPLTAMKRLLLQSPSLAPTIDRLSTIPQPTAGPPAPSAEQLVLIPPSPAEGIKPQRQTASRKRSAQ